MTYPFSRERSRGELLPLTHTTTTVMCDGTSSTQTISSVVQNGELETMWDSPTANFHKRSAAGDIIVTGMRTEKRTGVFTGSGIKMGLISCPSPPGSSIASSDYTKFLPYFALTKELALDHYGYGMVPTSLDPRQLSDLAGTSVLANVDTSTADGLVTLAELRKTIDTLSNPISSITNYLSGSRRRNGKAFSRMSASQFLQIYYGILPTIKDMENILKAASEIARPLRKTARASQSSQVVTDLGTFHYQGTSWYIDVNYSWSESITLRRGILYESGLDQIGAFGLRLSDVPSALFELTPYSFVLDWFSNLGTYIRALSPVSGVRYLGAWETWKMLQTCTATVVSSGVPAAYSDIYQNIRPCTDKMITSYETRGRNAKPVYDASLRFRNNLNEWKVLAGLSLITQQLTKR